MKRFKYLPRSYWTPRYLVDRILEGRYRHTHDDEPWLTPTAIDLLDAWLRPDDAALEFGSGHSTAWFAARVGSMVSVEHDTEWHRRVKPKLEGLGVDYRLCPGHDEYVGVTRGFGEATLDFVLVDGEFRDECATGVLDAIKPGGLLALDNANWFIQSPGTRSPWQMTQPSDLWRTFTEQVSGWRQIWTTNGVTDTAFFVRPC